jgi:hypothetical protein
MATLAVPSDKATKDAINQFNLEMRQQPWYQEWFQRQGLDPNKVKLSKPQREELEKLALANGAPPDAFDDMMIDPAGNLNTEHGFASLPTWAKIAIGAGAVAGGYFAAPAIASAIAPNAAVPGTVASTSYGTGMAALPAAIPTSIAGGSAVAGAVAPVAVGTTAAAGGTLSTMDRVGQMMRAGSGAIGRATEAAAGNRVAGDDLNMRARGQDISAENAFQGQQLSMAELEAKQQDQARRNLYRASVLKNPQTSVENPRGAPTFSPELMEGMTNLEKQALDRLREEAQYSTGKLRKPRDFSLTPFTPTRQGTMERVGNWLAPGLSIANMATELY